MLRERHTTGEMHIRVVPAAIAQKNPSPEEKEAMQARRDAEFEARPLPARLRLRAGQGHPAGMSR